METTGIIGSYIGVIQGMYWGYIVEKKMGTTIMGLGFRLPSLLLRGLGLRGLGV